MSKPIAPRQPAHIVAASNHTTPDIVWAAVRALKEFTHESLVLHLDKQHRVVDTTIRSYVESLYKGGFIDITHTENLNGSCRIHHYQLVKDVGIEAPRLTRDGKTCIKGVGRENLWRTMRILGDFNCRELAIAASTEETPIKENTAKDYIKHLYSAGYLLCVKEAVRSKNHQLSRYRLLPSKYTGPRPPQVQRLKQVFDPNLNQVMSEESLCN